MATGRGDAKRLENKWRPPANPNLKDEVVTMIEATASNVKLVKCADPMEASQKANTEAANTGGFSLPGTLFRQGARHSICTAFPIRRVQATLDVDSAKRRGTVSDVLAAVNRPTMDDHVHTIADYLVENVGNKYILPPMTLNVRQAISVYYPDYPSDLLPVFIVVPMTAKLSVTDGGHRAKAIQQAAERMNIDQLSDFQQDAVAVMITLESDLAQVHQDFADCSKTKALPKSQLAAYDRRNPANGLVLGMVENCPLFVDKIDSTSQTLSSTSANLFLTNQVRQLVKELLVGDYAMADAAFEEKAKELLISSDHLNYVAEQDRFVSYVDRVTEAVPVLKQIAHLPPGVPRNIIRERRQEGWICLTATGMVIIGRIGYELFKTGNPNWQQYADRLGAVDWSRGAEIWQGSIVRSSKMATQRAPVRVAVEKVRRAIGLPPNLKLDAEINEIDNGPSGSINILELQEAVA
jgi:DNA sulfur modification protein DndB